MELNLNYQYTYFIYPYAIKTEKYKKYITSMIKNKNYHLKFFDGFKDIDLYNYFIPSIKSNTFQDFTFSKEKWAFPSEDPLIHAKSIPCFHLRVIGILLPFVCHHFAMG